MKQPNNKKIILECVMLRLYPENNCNVISVDEFKYNADPNHNYMWRKGKNCFMY